MEAPALNVLRGGEQASGGTTAGLTREVEDEQRPIGRKGNAVGRPGLFRYDLVQGLAHAELRYDVDKVDRMSLAEANAMLHRIHVAYGVEKQVEGFIYDFDQAFLLCMAINGTSQFVPSERAKFRFTRLMPGSNDDYQTHEYDYRLAIVLLDTDSRRFGRAMADHIVPICKNFLANCDFGNDDQVYLRGLMLQLASDRGVARHPWLISDCAEAAVNLTSAERGAIKLSKVSVIGASTNAVDKRNLAVPIRSADNFDSSVGESVSNGVDVHAQGKSHYYN